MTIRDCKKTALLVIDVQNALVECLPPQRADELTRNINVLLHKARAGGIPVVYVQHHDEELVYGTAPWEIRASVAPQGGEPIVHKHHRDAFRETNLADLLHERSVENVVVCGMQTEFCIDATVREAERRGYRVTLVSDAHATFDADDTCERSIIAQVERVLRGQIADIVPAAVALGSSA